MPHSVASDLGLNCFHMAQKKDAALIWATQQVLRVTNIRVHMSFNFHHIMSNDTFQQLFLLSIQQLLPLKQDLFHYKTEYKYCTDLLLGYT